MKNIKLIKLTRNPFILFLPFLIIYIVFVLLLYSPKKGGDEWRYFDFANNLLNGFYSPGGANINLTNGPGYPLLLVPFLLFHLPKVCVVLLNAVFHYLSVVFLFKALQQFVSMRKAIIFSLFWACYYVAYQNMPSAVTETFTMFLVSILIFFCTRAFATKEISEVKKDIFFAGLILGYIVLTKVIFGYVVLVMLIGILFLWIFNKKAANYRKGVIILSIAFITFTPYLVYTYHLTGRVFYLSTADDALYWMTSPYHGEYGDWKGTLDQNPVDLGNYNIPGAGDTLIAHHKEDFDKINELKGELAKGDLYKKIAIQNIKSYPLNYGKNIFFNIGRIFFHYPFSYAVQRPKSLFVMPINGIILTFILLCMIPTLVFWRRIIFSLRFFLFIAFLYLGASSLVSAETRMITIIVPILIFWFAYIIQKTVKLNLRDW